VRALLQVQIENKNHGPFLLTSGSGFFLINNDLVYTVNTLKILAYISSGWNFSQRPFKSKRKNYTKGEILATVTEDSMPSGM
jgi:hypothetical protein